MDMNKNTTTQTLTVNAPKLYTFSLNGRSYRTDEQTAKVLRSIVPAAKSSGDTSAVQAILELGLLTGVVEQSGFYSDLHRM